MQSIISTLSDEITLVGFLGDDQVLKITQGKQSVTLSEKQAIELAYTILNHHYGI